MTKTPRHRAGWRGATACPTWRDASSGGPDGPGPTPGDTIAGAPEGDVPPAERKRPQMAKATPAGGEPNGTPPSHTQEGPATTRVTGPSARKCPSLVSDVLLSHGLLRSTIGARGLNFRVRNGTGCTSPAMVADQRGAFGCKGAGLARCPGGRTAQRVPVQKVARPRLLRVRGEELGLLVQLG